MQKELKMETDKSFKLRWKKELTDDILADTVKRNLMEVATSVQYFCFASLPPLQQCQVVTINSKF